MQKKYLLLFVLLHISSYAFAQSASFFNSLPTVKTTDINQSIAYAPVIVANEHRPMFYIGNSPIGIHAATILGHPTELGFYLFGGLLIGARIGYFVTPVSFFTFSSSFDTTINLPGEQYPMETTFLVSSKSPTLDFSSQEFFTRWFIHNSWNLIFRYGSLKLTSTMEVDANISNSATKRAIADVASNPELSYSAKFITLGVGNMWIIDQHLTLGVDWLVYSFIFGTKYSWKLQSFDSAIYDAKIQQHIDILQETLTNNLSTLLSKKNLNTFMSFPGLLNFSIGYSF